MRSVTRAVTYFAAAVVWAALVLAFTHRPDRDLRLPDDDVREVAGATRIEADGTYVLIATTGEHCFLSATDWHRAYPGERWACRWLPPEPPRSTYVPLP